ncbi:MAG: transcription antitermination factor NusB [Gammaproteobacteria bacterium]|nr:transcription antitermination factor NusB [Gammaproteobacteria bacterium]
MAKGGRHLARRCVVQALYQWQVTKQDHEDIEKSFIKNSMLSGKHKDYFLSLINIIPQCIDDIDSTIKPFLDRDADKLDLIEQAILRVATYELKYDQNIPTSVVLDEAIDIAKVFGSEHGYKYVNGVLDKVAKEVRN